MDYSIYGEREKVEIINALEETLVNELVAMRKMSGSDAQGVVANLIQQTV